MQSLLTERADEHFYGNGNGHAWVKFQLCTANQNDCVEGFDNLAQSPHCSSLSLCNSTRSDRRSSSSTRIGRLRPRRPRRPRRGSGKRPMSPQTRNSSVPWKTSSGRCRVATTMTPKEFTFSGLKTRNELIIFLATEFEVKVKYYRNVHRCFGGSRKGRNINYRADGVDGPPEIERS